MTQTPPSPDNGDRAPEGALSPEETRSLQESRAGDSVAGRTGGLSADTEAMLADLAKEGTNVDMLVARLVIDQGLATKDEVKQCVALARERSESTLAQLLVDNAYVTERQISRLRQVVEAERTGQQIPGYKLLGKLGAGAMATVFKGRQLSLDRLVAIKILPRKFSQSPQFIERFYAEGRAAAQLNHPNIVQAYDVGKAGDYHYFVMEFVDGRTVHDDIVKQKKMSEKDAVHVAIQVAEALQHAHERGLIHRDVKPKNVMIARSGVVKLADLGLARAVSDKEAAEAEAGKAFGTPYYISPEQIRGETNVGPQADIYSLGATLYHMVTGNVPFDGKNPSSVMHKHLKSELVPPDHVNPKLSAGVSQVIEMMMAKGRPQRYKDAKDLLIDLRAVAKGDQPVLAGREFREMDLASLATAEATAPTVIPEDSSSDGSGGGSAPLIVLIAMGVALAVSLVINVVQALA